MLSYMFISGYGLYMHSFFKFESENAGYPQTYIYTDRRKMRFDWIKLYNSDDCLVPCQLCCLLELEHPERKPIFLFAAIECEYCPNMYDNPVFPKVRYKKIRGSKRVKSGDLMIIVDLVDLIVEPSFVVPTSCQSKDYFLTDSKARDDVTFFCAPLEFILRDSWEDMIHLEDIGTLLHSDPTVRQYIKSNENERRQMYEKLVSSLEEEEEEEGEEEEGEENSIKAVPKKRRKIATDNSYESDDESYLSE